MYNEVVRHLSIAIICIFYIDLVESGNEGVGGMKSRSATTGALHRRNESDSSSTDRIVLKCGFDSVRGSWWFEFV
jgi:hypothetical protein